MSWTTNSIVFRPAPGHHASLAERRHTRTTGQRPVRRARDRARNCWPTGRRWCSRLMTVGGRNDALSSIVAQSLKSGSRQTLVRGGTNAWNHEVPTGAPVVKITGGILLAPCRSIRHSCASLETRCRSCRAWLVVRRHRLSIRFLISGSLLYLPGPVSTSSRLTWMAIVDKGAVSPLNPSAGACAWPRVDLDGRRIARRRVA